MSNGSPKSLPGPKLTKVQSIGIIVAALAVISGIGYKTMAPYEPPPLDFSKRKLTEFDQWAIDKYKSTGGDFTKLEQRDKDKINAASQGKGANYFATYAVLAK